jgi:hypothetical protein
MEILVMTCDRFQWVLPIFFHLFKKFWADCPWPVTVVGGKALEDDLDSYGVYRGDDSVWGGLLLEYLAQKDDGDFVCILLEDYVIMDEVETKKITACLNILRADPKVQFMRLNAVPGPTLPWIPDLNIGRFDKEKASYLSSLMPTIFRVRYLRQLVEPHWTAHDVEIAGTLRARTLPGIFLGNTKGALIPIHNYLIRGRINTDAKREVEGKW